MDEKRQVQFLEHRKAINLLVEQTADANRYRWLCKNRAEEMLNMLGLVPAQRGSHKRRLDRRIDELLYENTIG